MQEHCIRPDFTIFIDVQATTSLMRIAVNRGFHFELFETEHQLGSIREQYLRAINGLHKQGEVIHVIPGEPPADLVQRNIWKRVEARFLDLSFLGSSEESRLFSFKELVFIRIKAEEELGLTFLGGKEYSPSRDPLDTRIGTHGGGSLEFLDENGVKFRANFYLVKKRDRIKAILAQTSAAGRSKIDALQRVCNLALGKLNEKQKNMET